MTIILGIDPGSRITGYGLIRVNAERLEYLDSGCVRTTTALPLSQRLLQIYDAICELMDTFTPGEVAIEQIFMHENAGSALKLGHARGVAMVAAASHRVAIAEYSPREVKESVVGYGAASKAQVNHMVVHLLTLNNAPQSDAADALAIAICHSYRKGQMSSLLGTRRRGRR